MLPLEEMLDAEIAEERVAAAMALIPLARESRALPVLREAISMQPSLRVGAGQVLPWLPWEDRLAFFKFLTGEGKDIRSLAAAAAAREAAAGDATEQEGHTAALAASGPARDRAAARERAAAVRVSAGSVRVRVVAARTRVAAVMAREVVTRVRAAT